MTFELVWPLGVKVTVIWILSVSLVGDMYGTHIFSTSFYPLNVDTQQSLLTGWFSAAPAVFLAWNHFHYVEISVNKIFQKLFVKSTSFLAGAFPLTEGRNDSIMRKIAQL